MRREILMIPVMAVVAIMTGCGDTGAPESSRSNTSEDILISSPSSRVWSLEGRFVDFASICDLETGPLPPSKHVKQSGKWIFTGCQNLDARLQEPRAIIITVRNSTDTSRNLSVPMLSDVVVNTGKSSETAVAFWHPGFYDQPGWVAEMENAVLEVELGPGVEVELLYLLPQFSGRVTIKIADIGTLKD